MHNVDDSVNELSSLDRNPISRIITMQTIKGLDMALAKSNTVYRSSQQHQFVITVF